VWQTFKAMTWCGFLVIWTWCVATSPSLTPRSSHRRLLTLSILPLSLSESVYANLEGYAELGRRSQHRTYFRLII